MIKQFSFTGLVLFYFVAGLNHFRDPAFYLKLIPPYLPNPELINLLAGMIEIGFSLLLISPKTRNRAVYGIIAMLIAFIPSHVYALSFDSFMFGNIQVPMWAVWLRLIVIHPILIIWVWLHRVKADE